MMNASMAIMMIAHIGEYGISMKLAISGDYSYEGAEVPREGYAEKHADTCCEDNAADDQLHPAPAMIRPVVVVVRCLGS